MSSNYTIEQSSACGVPKKHETATGKATSYSHSDPYDKAYECADTFLDGWDINIVSPHPPMKKFVVASLMKGEIKISETKNQLAVNLVCCEAKLLVATDSIALKSVTSSNLLLRRQASNTLTTK